MQHTLHHLRCIWGWDISKVVPVHSSEPRVPFDFVHTVPAQPITNKFIIMMLMMMTMMMVVVVIMMMLMT